MAVSPEMQERMKRRKVLIRGEYDSFAESYAKENKCSNHSPLPQYFLIQVCSPHLREYTLSPRDAASVSFEGFPHIGSAGSCGSIVIIGK